MNKVSIAPYFSPNLTQFHSHLRLDMFQSWSSLFGFVQAASGETGWSTLKAEKMTFLLVRQTTPDEFLDTEKYFNARLQSQTRRLEVLSFVQLLSYGQKSINFCMGGVLLLRHEQFTPTAWHRSSCETHVAVIFNSTLTVGLAVLNLVYSWAAFRMFSAIRLCRCLSVYLLKNPVVSNQICHCCCIRTRCLDRVHPASPAPELPVVVPPMKGHSGLASVFCVNRSLLQLSTSAPESNKSCVKASGYWKSSRLRRRLRSPWKRRASSQVRFLRTLFGRTSALVQFFLEVELKSHFQWLSNHESSLGSAGANIAQINQNCAFFSSFPFGKSREKQKSICWTFSLHPPVDVSHSQTRLIHTALFSNKCPKKLCDFTGTISAWVRTHFFNKGGIHIRFLDHKVDKTLSVTPKPNPALSTVFYYKIGMYRPVSKLTKLFLVQTFPVEGNDHTRRDLCSVISILAACFCWLQPACSCLRWSQVWCFHRRRSAAAVVVFLKQITGSNFCTSKEPKQFCWMLRAHLTSRG